MGVVRHTDVAVVGGGLAGSIAAAMLGRAGFDVALVDPHPQYPPDFRCEKLDGPQLAILRRTGLADAVLRVATHDGESWVARSGRVVEKRPGDQYGILYDALVNTIRAEIPAEVACLRAKATAISTGADRQTVSLSTGDEVSARLVVLANGPSAGLRGRLGLTCRVVSPRHSISLGFDVRPTDRAGFRFRALTYYFERPSERMAYLSLFPIGSTMRANLFGYRDLHDPWLRRFREAPAATLRAAMPGLGALTGGFAVGDGIRVRPVDLYVVEGHRQAGVVLIGDAFATSCPAAGTGCRKVFTDVERLCNVHVPVWLGTPGMSAEKIGAFYDDPVKRACDAHSARKAHALRAFSTGTGLPWAARRWAKFVGQWMGRTP
jgi:2-polyprenyl-6-methoxyphenol hydroxylase-like FAD-dependent oxidoreductase